MGNPTGFIDHAREEVGHRPVSERVKDYFEIDLPLTQEQIIRQASRCQDCGIPFCHGAGCPVINRIPEFNDLVFRGKWREACENLHSTNNFPEVTGRVCPALCEAACTLSVNSQPVLIKHIELQIVERGWAEGWIVPLPAERKTGKHVAVIGSGPAGLAVAQQLARAGHDVVIFEKDNRIGGLLRYGIPDFKLAKSVLDRRLEQMRAEGVQFETGVTVGVDVSARYLRQRFDAICLTMGAGEPRNLVVPGRGLENVYYAMDYLVQQNRLNAGDQVDPKERISASGRVVAVIGGGDTGSDCVGTAIRQGAREVHQFEIMPQPPEAANPQTPWPMYPRVMRTSSSQEEGCNRRWSVLTKQLSGIETRVHDLHGIEVEWSTDSAGRPTMKEKPGSEFRMKVDLVLLAMGFTHVTHSGIVEELGLSLDDRGNVAVSGYATSQPGVFAAGDTVSGASLVVRAISSGRGAADTIDTWLKR